MGSRLSHGAYRIFLKRAGQAKQMPTLIVDKGWGALPRGGRLQRSAQLERPQVRSGHCRQVLLAIHLIRRHRSAGGAGPEAELGPGTAARSGVAGYLGEDTGPPFGRALDPEAAADRGDAVLQSPQAGAPGRVGSAGPVVDG